MVYQFFYFHDISWWIFDHATQDLRLCRNRKFLVHVLIGSTQQNILSIIPTLSDRSYIQNSCLVWFVEEILAGGEPILEGRASRFLSFAFVRNRRRDRKKDRTSSRST